MTIYSPKNVASSLEFSSFHHQPTHIPDHTYTHLVTLISVLSSFTDMLLSLFLWSVEVRQVVHVDWQVEVKKAEPRDLRLMADTASPATSTFIVAPNFLPGPLTALPSTGLLANTGSWNCSPASAGMCH